MPLISSSARYVIQHPFTFAWRVLSGFGRNQGLLLAGAVAYYALLSLVPMLIIAVIALSHVVAQEELLATIGRYLEWLVPSQSRSVLIDVAGFVDAGIGMSALLLVMMMFFSSLAFSGLEKSMTIIFAHRNAAHKRHPVVSALLPYCFVLALGIGLLIVTVVSVGLQVLAQESIHVFSRDWSLSGFSGAMLYLLGASVEVLIFTTLYLIMPVGPTRLRYALVGGITATVLWEAVRHLLVWYFIHLSKVSVVYGSLTTAVVALFSMEIAATLLLFGAQVIAEYERVGQE